MATVVDPETAAVVGRLAPITIANLQREYPNGIMHHFVKDGEAIRGTPATLHPAFYGCYDWHSAVHSHWQLVRALRLTPAAAFVPAAVAALNRNLTPENLAVELAYVTARPSYEMPYGMAWLLQLAAELREQETDQTNRWRDALLPLEQHATTRFRVYLSRLPHPVRTGLHNQSAFALALAWDWTQVAGDSELAALIAERARDFYGGDSDAPLAYEPSGSDFLSPTLAEADLLRRVLSPAEFSDWLWGFFGPAMVETLPQRLAPVRVVDYADGQLSHYSGLNISRAWMLRGIAGALAADDARQAMLLNLAQAHQDLGLPDALHPDYMVSHWAPTFVLYLLSNRGLG
ncbi:MAG TPA: DUF2891 domain-containing protein [Caldilineaceae bacterium]|nr:DUF2891 domain-containing protein [Caldilineaceae bacterium]